MHTKKHLGFKALRKTISMRLRQIKDPRKDTVDYTLHDCFMSSFAMMFFQYSACLKKTSANDRVRYEHQILELTDRLYQQCRKTFGSRIEFWNQLRCTIRVLIFTDFERKFPQIGTLARLLGLLHATAPAIETL